MIKVVIAEDSPVMQDLLKHVLASDPEISIVGVAANGKEAIELVKNLNPDVLTMDVNMPILNGLQATKIIMQECPLPVIIVSSDFHPQDVEASVKALQYGAVAIAEKPHSYGEAKFEKIASKLVQTVKLMSEIKVVRRVFQTPEIKKSGHTIPITGLVEIRQKIDLIAIGASTGGPQALEKILSQLPQDFPIPIVLVQHITSGFTAGFCDWLKTISCLPIEVAAPDAKVCSGKCYIAPEGFHLEVTKDLHFKLSDGLPEYGSRPSVSALFKSIARSFSTNVAAVLLSGMGKDGAVELGNIRQRGGLTIAQDNESSLIFGMPGEAIRLGAATYVLSATEIGTFLTRLYH